MCIAVIGGMDRLDRIYKEEGDRFGVSLKVFTRAISGLAARLRQVDGVVIFTGKTSHRIKNEAVLAAKSARIPVVMSHSCGVCSLRESLDRLIGGSEGTHPCSSCPNGCPGKRKGAERGEPVGGRGTL